MWWGYTANPEDPDNDTAYFDNFDDPLKAEELKEHYNGFKKMNEETLANLGKPQDTTPSFTYQQGDTIKFINVFKDWLISEKLYIKER